MTGGLFDSFLDAFDEGDAARLAGTPRDANPHPDGSRQRRGWFSGHKDRDREMARRLERAVVAEGAVR